MDLELIQHLSDEQKERYTNLVRLFEMPGWAIIKKWAVINAEESRDRGASAPSWEANRIALGERIVYDVLRQMEDITEREYTLLAEENAAKVEEEELLETELEHE